jgi:glucose-6-phosphate-specific signal transduction histidine kinase
MAFWQRLLITLVAIVAASIIAGLIWHSLFNKTLPSYIGGVIGGLTALPVWDFLKRVAPKPEKGVKSALDPK